MQFFKLFQSEIKQRELIWFDGQLLADKTNQSKRLLVLLSTEETCHWQLCPQLKLWQKWSWYRALEKRSRLSTAGHYYAKPSFMLWETTPVFLQQQWQPINVDVTHELKHSSVKDDLGIYGFNQWWQAWWPNTRFAPWLSRLNKQDLVIVYLALDSGQWVQIAHFQQQACWWRLVTIKTSQSVYLEYQRFEDFVLQQPLLANCFTKAILLLDLKRYCVLAPSESKGMSLNVTAYEQALPHQLNFDDLKVMRRLSYQQPTYRIRPWYFNFRIARLRKTLHYLNAGFLALVICLGLWWSLSLSQRQLSKVTLDPNLLAMEVLTSGQQKEMQLSFNQWRDSYEAWHDLAGQDLAPHWWQVLDEAGFNVERIDWAWDKAGYWQWQIDANVAISNRQLLAEKLQVFSAQVNTNRNIVSWQEEVIGLELPAGRLLSPEQIKIRVKWQWQQWP